MPLVSGQDLAYCKRCDLAFCEEHRGEHSEGCGGTPTIEAAVERDAQFCSVCAGIWKARAP